MNTCVSLCKSVLYKQHVKAHPPTAAQIAASWKWQNSKEDRLAAVRALVSEDIFFDDADEAKYLLADSIVNFAFSEDDVDVQEG